MFNRPQPSKRVKAWRPEPGLLSQNSSRGFATTRWGGAEDGFMVDDIKRTKDGFALDEYAQVPLSPQAIAALKRLKAMEPDENVIIADEVVEAPEKFQIETWNANAHLPFVVDAYEFDDEDIAVGGGGGDGGGEADFGAELGGAGGAGVAGGEWFEGGAVPE